MITWHKHWSKTCWYGFCPDAKTWDKERARVLKSCHLDIGEYPTSTGLTTCYRTPDPRALVTLNSEGDTDPLLLVGTIAHEAVHVVKMAFHAMAEDEPGEETLAYSVGHVASDIFTAYSLTRGKHLKKVANGRHPRTKAKG